MKSERDKQQHDSWQLDEEVRRRRLREDADRPMGVNLAETIALSEFFASFAGSARRAQGTGET